MLGCAVGLVGVAMLIIKASPSNVANASSAFDRVTLIGMIAASLSAWFAIGALLSGAFAKSALPRGRMAVALGFCCAGFFGASVCGMLPRIVGAFVVPVVAGLIVGRASWATTRPMQDPSLAVH